MRVLHHLKARREKVRQPSLVLCGILGSAFYVVGWRFQFADSYG